MNCVKSWNQTSSISIINLFKQNNSKA
uniref:Uncharacterized protein n=1 Tax=Arundo donax TaxID=35708 RepID=A0A0A9HGD9_ARUDO